MSLMFGSPSVDVSSIINESGSSFKDSSSVMFCLSVTSKCLQTINISTYCGNEGWNGLRGLQRLWPFGKKILSLHCLRLNWKQNIYNLIKCPIFLYFANILPNYKTETEILCDYYTILDELDEVEPNNN